MAYFFAYCGTLVVAILLVTGTVLAESAAPSATAALVASNGETVSLFLAIVKVIGSLLLVVALMVLTVILLRRLGLARSGLAGKGLIEVMESRMIAPKKYVAVVKIAGEVVALGITEQAISLLITVEPAAVEASAASRTPRSETGVPQPFAVLLERAGSVFGRTAKKTDEGENSASPNATGRSERS